MRNAGTMFGDTMTLGDISGAARIVAWSLTICIATLTGNASRADADGLQATCTGSMEDGWTFAAQTQDTQFLHVIWTGPQGQTRVALLAPYSVNADGFPVFTGTMQDTNDVTLVDQSGGSPAADSGIMVYSEPWGWMQGTCRILDTANAGETFFSDDIQRSILGLRDARATNWLQRNGFGRERVVEFTRSSKTERWSRAPDERIDIIFFGGIVSDVILVAE